jgi:hypothetical protein
MLSKRRELCPESPTLRALPDVKTYQNFFFVLKNVIPSGYHWGRGKKKKQEMGIFNLQNVLFLVLIITQNY